MLACSALLASASSHQVARDVGVTAFPAASFLNSIGTQSAVSVRGETFDKTLECVRFLGVRWLRAGIEGDVPVQQFLDLHSQTGVRFSWGLGSGGSDLSKLLTTAKQLAAGGALLSFEGPNEPNNWACTYRGQVGGRDKSWLPIARLQSDLYKSVKSDPILMTYPVWSISENGAETDNVGLQFLAIPLQSHLKMPDATKYADAANVHNYIYHPNSPGLENNKTWNAADPSPACRVDGLFGEYGITWAHHYLGYSVADLQTLPRVTTETGAAIGGAVTEEIHAKNLLTMYLDQFKRGWSYTANYLLRDRVDEGGNQQFGFYKPDYTPRKAATYLHNLTTVLADNSAMARPGKLSFSTKDQPATVHNLLLQKSDGTFELIFWNELVIGSQMIKIQIAGQWDKLNVYDPTIGTTPTAMPVASHAVVLSLSDHPLIVEFPPPPKPAK